MVSKENKSRMRQFLVDRLEESQKYEIKEADNSHILIAQKPELVENPLEIYVLLHNSKISGKEYQDILSRNTRDRKFFAEVFYKDGQNFMVRLEKRGKIKGDERSLKKYTSNEINKMIHLRKLEKMALKRQSRKRELVYFQPESERLNEGLRTYKMNPVYLNYSHIQPEHQAYGFVESTLSEDYVIAQEIPEQGIVGGKIGFNRVFRNSPKLIIVPRN